MTDGQKISALFFVFADSGNSESSFVDTDFTYIQHGYLPWIKLILSIKYVQEYLRIFIHINILRVLSIF